MQGLSEADVTSCTFHLASNPRCPQNFNVVVIKGRALVQRTQYNALQQNIITLCILLKLELLRAH